MSETDAERIEREKIEALRPMSRLEFQILYSKCGSSGWVYGEFNETLYQQYIQRYGFFLCHLLFLKYGEADANGLLTKLNDSDIYFLIDKSRLIHTISLPGTNATNDKNKANATNINWFFAESPNTLETYVFNPKNKETPYYTGPLTILKKSSLTAATELTAAARAAIALNVAPEKAKAAEEAATELMAAAAKAAELAAATAAAAEKELAAATAAEKAKETAATELRAAADTELAAAAATTIAAKEAETAAATELGIKLSYATNSAEELKTALAATELEDVKALAASTALAVTALAALIAAALVDHTTTQKPNWINQNIILLDFFPFPIIMSTDIRKDVAMEGYTFRMHLSEYFKPLVENVKKIFDAPAPVAAPANVYLISPPYTSVHAIFELTDFEWAELVTLNASSTYKQSIEQPSFGFDTKKTPEKIYDSHLEIREKEFDKFKKKFKLETSSSFLNNNIPSAKDKYPEFCAYLKKRIYLNDGNRPGIPGVNE